MVVGPNLISPQNQPSVDYGTYRERVRHIDVAEERRIVTSFHAHRALSTWKLVATQIWYIRVPVHHDFTGRFNAAHTSSRSTK